MCVITASSTGSVQCTTITGEQLQRCSLLHECLLPLHATYNSCAKTMMLPNLVPLLQVYRYKHSAGQTAQVSTMLTQMITLDPSAGVPATAFQTHGSCAKLEGMLPTARTLLLLQHPYSSQYVEACTGPSSAASHTHPPPNVPTETVAVVESVSPCAFSIVYSIFHEKDGPLCQ
jgi:hypothetical protein